MEKYVLGIDLGTSAVKVSCLDQYGKIKVQKSISYPILMPENGYREQDPEIWVKATVECIQKIIKEIGKDSPIDGLSFSGQMHSLVLLDKNYCVIRPAILWNDARSEEEANYINDCFGQEIVKITGNKAVAGFTLPKLLWIKKNERENYNRIAFLLMPKDYVRYRLTGKINMDLSDATGTLMLNIEKNTWSKRILDYFKIPLGICPSLVNSTEFIGYPLKEICDKTGLQVNTKIFAGAGDNAAAAVGAGIYDSNNILCSIGTSGVVLSDERKPHEPYEGSIQMEHHAIENRYYSMGVTLSAGDSLNWFKKTLCPDLSFDQIIEKASQSPIGSNHLLFSPYLSGERAPYSDSYIRGSFIGLSQTTSMSDFCRAVIEGITFSLKDLINIYESNYKKINKIISIGGGAKSQFWLQIQADIFQKEIICLKNEQGPGIGAAMIAAMGCRWFDDWESCINSFVTYKRDAVKPNESSANVYDKIYGIYRKMYGATAAMTRKALLVE